MIEKTEFLANKINEFIEKYGEVPPHWIFKPDSHPYSIFWRQGSGDEFGDCFYIWFEENLKTAGYIENNLNVNHSYEFYLGKDKPYILDNMEMIMLAQYTMNGEGWGCEMGNFTIDNKKFEHIGNINFTKRGFKQ